MLFLIDKLVTPFLNPLGGSLVLMVVVLGLMAAGLRRTAAGVTAFTLVALYFSSTPFVAEAISGVLERQYPPRPISETPSAEVIVVLGGATAPALPPREGPDLNEHADRLVQAAALFKAGKAPAVIASGGSWRDPDRPEAIAMRTLLVALGVPEQAIIPEPRSLDTAQNAWFSAELMRQKGWTSALLVTSGVHMPRAVAAFRRAGVTVTPSATDIVDAPDPAWPIFDWLPHPDALAQTSDALRELVGMAYYRLRGWA